MKDDYVVMSLIILIFMFCDILVLKELNRLMDFNLRDKDDC